jgi:RND superfamily putative drug exporter
VGVIAAGAMLAAAAPALHGDSRPFSSFDLPLAAHARTTLAEAASGATPAGAAASATGGGAEVPGDARQSLFEKLALAAGVSAGALAIVLVLSFRSLRVLPVAIVTLLPAAAACGLCVFLFQDGHLAGAINQERQGALETGALASLLAALAAVSAARAVAAIEAVRARRSLAHGLTMEHGAAAEVAAFLLVPGALAATLIAAAAAGVLAGSDLYSAREFGLAVAAGLLLDLLLLRLPLVAALVRWGGAGRA